MRASAFGSTPLHPEERCRFFYSVKFLFMVARSPCLLGLAGIRQKSVKFFTSRPSRHQPFPPVVVSSNIPISKENNDVLKICRFWRTLCVCIRNFFVMIA